MRSYAGTLFFCVILIASMYTFPYNIQQAYGHENDGFFSHEFCWDKTFNSISFVLGIVEFVVIAILMGLAPITFGASLLNIPPLKTGMFWAKLVSPAITWPLAGLLCNPQTIAPPSTVADKTHLDCNTEQGFSFVSIQNNIINTGEFKYPKKVIPLIDATTGPDRAAPPIFSMNLIFASLITLAVFLIFIIIDAVSIVKTPPGPDKLLKEFLKFSLKTAIFKFILKTLLTKLAVSAALLTLSVTAGGIFNWRGTAKAEHPNDGITTHAFATISDLGVQQPPSTKFNLGKNSITYFGTAKLGATTGKTDTATLPFNVYDNEPPEIIFGSAKNVTVEANTHYGFEKTPRSLPFLKLDMTVKDNCSAPKDVSLEYIGPEFFLLTKLKKDQFGQWKTTDKAAPDYWALSFEDVKQTIETEIPALLEQPDAFVAPRIAQINPSQQVEVNQAKVGSSTVRHLIATVANDEILELIRNNTAAIAAPPTADVIISGELRDAITNDKITIVGVPEKEDQIVTDIDIDISSISSRSLSQDRISQLLNNQLEPSTFVDFYTGTLRPTTLGTETAKSNVFVDFQFVTVLDRIAPNILVTEDLALVVNSTNPGSTNSTLLNDPKKGCSGTAPNNTCKLKIRPPALFDIADPFPTLFENFTGNGTFNEVQGDLIANFTIGVSFIGWKAVDFSGNGNNTIVTQIVNLKLNGTNIISNVFDVNVTAFSTVPKQVTLIANNTDMDPLKFLIEQNPSKGILDTPLDAVFLTKFQQLGQVSKLTGITNEATSPNDVFITDSRNARVLKVDNMDGLDELFVGPQLGTPVGISLTGSGNFIISDWSKNKIFETTNSGTVLETFDVTGLFKNPEVLSVNQSSNDIFVTDSGNFTISRLTDFDIFNLPQGMEVDNNSGDVYVVDQLDNIVKIFNFTGFSSGVLGSGELVNPSDVAVDAQSNIYVLGLDNIIRNYTSNNLLVDEFGARANAQSFFNASEGIAINGTNIFVADTQNNKVHKITSFNPQIVEDYTTNANWILNNTQEVNITGGVVQFNNATSGSGPINRVFKDLQTVLNDSWSAEFEIKSGVLKNGANAFIWLLTNSTKHPQNVTSQNALGVVYEEQKLKIFQRHNSTNTTSSGSIPLPSGKGIDYFVSFEKLNSTKASMVVYTDSNKTTQLASGKEIHSISNLITGLSVLQHANNIVQGGNAVDLLIDDTVINPLVTWIGKCDSGPNCVGDISNQFTCTDTTCFGAGSGSNIGQFDSPNGVAANSTHLFVSDFNNNRIQIFDANDGTHQQNLMVMFPTDVEYTSFDGGRIIASSNSSQVEVFKNDGSSFVFGNNGTQLGNFTSPTGLGIDSFGNIYVVDNNNLNVQKFDSSGNFIQEWKSSIDSRFGNFIEIFDFYSPDIEAGALDVKDNKVLIGNWNSANREVIVADSRGGKITKLGLPSSLQNPHSLAFNSTNKIFITDPIARNIALLDGADGSLIRNINVSNISGFNITSTGITITNVAPGFPTEQLFVFDNSTEKIFAVNEGSNSAVDAFSLKDLFSNLNDIAFNSTHVFGLDVNQNKSSIIQIRWDKGITNEIDLGENVTGIAQGKGIDSELVFFIANRTDDELFSYNRTDSTITRILNLTEFNVKPFGIGINPMISGLVNITITKDSGIEAPRGLAFGSDNKTLFVASGNTDEIKIFNVDSGKLNQTFSDEIKSPTDIVLLNNSTLFVANYGESNILEFNLTDGEVSIFAQKLSGISRPTGLAISPDGQSLFVSSSTDDVILKYFLFDIITESQVNYVDKNGVPRTFNQTFTNATKGDLDLLFVNSTNKGTLQNPMDIEFGPDDGLYVASFDTNEILKWDKFGNHLGVFGDTNKEKSKLEGPSSLTFSPDGKSLYVSSVGTSSILHYNGATGAFIGTLSDETTINPDGVAVGKDGNLFVSNRGTNEILEYGELKVKYYISDWTSGTNRIIGFNSTGSQVGLPFTPNATLINPKNIEVDNKGKLWIVDAGPPSTLYPLNPVSNRLIGDPIDISTLVEEEAPSVQPINGTSMFVDDFGNTYDAIPQDVVSSVNPRGISIGSSNELYVSDWDNHRIVALDKTGKFLGQVKLNSTFTKPLDIAFNQTGDSNKINDIWVFDANFTGLNTQRLISLDVDKQFKQIKFEEKLSPFLRGLDINGTFMVTTPSNSGSLFKIDSTLDANFTSKHFIIPLGIDLTSSGIYVSDWKEKRIVQLDADADFAREFDFKLVGFPTPEQGDIEVDITNQFFWITEPRRATIDKVAFNGTVLKYSSVGDKFVFISTIYSDILDNFYVASSDDNTISKFDIRGTQLAKSDPVSSGTSFIDLTVGNDPTNSVSSVFVAVSGAAKQILKYNSTDLQQIGVGFTLADKCGTSCSPVGVAVDASGNIYVSNSTMKITKLDSTGNLASSFTIPGTAGEIKDIVIDSNNNLFAADQKLHHVYKYNLTSSSLIGWLGKCDLNSNATLCIQDSLHSKGFTCIDGECTNPPGKSFGRGAGQFFQPTNIALDGLNNVYVSDVRLSRSQAAEQVPDVDFTDVFNRGNVPRVQKFTQEGFYVQHVISDTNQTMVKGNFEWVKALAYGTNNFYVADIATLHVFDANPFSNIKFDPLTNFTSAQVTYESLVDIGVSVNETDNFLYRVFDGFNKSSNVGNVILTITDPDPDGDGLFGDIDLSKNVFSDDFASSIDLTFGSISDRGSDQKLIIREARDFTKGVYIQSDIRNTGTPAKVELCGNLAEIELTPGDRLEATCIFEDLTTATGVELKLLRGEISVKFLDKVGRSSTTTMLEDHELTFITDPYSFISGTNFDTLRLNVLFNTKTLTYNVPSDSIVKVDTAPPVFTDASCTTPLILEAESVRGVQWTGDINDSPAVQAVFTSHFDEILKFLNFTTSDVDNGDPVETQGRVELVTSNATAFFPYSNSSVPLDNKVQFFTVDKIGNNATCINTVQVIDQTPPKLVFDPSFTNLNDPNNIGITNFTHPNLEVARVFYDVPKIFDLPDLAGTPLEVPGHFSGCALVSGDKFKIGDNNIVGCSGNDLSGNNIATTFTVTVNPLPIGLTIRNVTASDETGPGLSVEDKIFVEFSVQTNRPEVSTKNDLDALFVLTNGDFGNAVSGKFVDPTNLVITINDISSPISLVPGVTTFDLKPNLNLTSASGALNSSGTNLVPNAITLGGNFSNVSPPYITSFMAAGAATITTDKNSQFYSDGDTFTIRHSKPTNAPGFNQLVPSQVLTKPGVDSLFSFSHELGEDYVGVWENPSTFVITVKEIRTGDMAFDPTLGVTTARVIGNIRNADETSIPSTSISTPLIGNFGEFTLAKDIKPSKELVETLPSGITLGIKFPNGTSVVLRSALIDLNEFSLSGQIQVFVDDGTKDCAFGCEITFYIHGTDLFTGLSLDTLRIFHDVNDNGVADPFELLIPTIEQVGKELFAVSVTLNSFTTIALVGGISGSGDGGDVPPSYEVGILGTEGSIELFDAYGILGTEDSIVVLDKLKFNNFVTTSVINVGEPYKIKLTLDLSGRELAHISLYTDLREFKTQISDSDAYVRYDSGIGVSKYDSKGIFKDADIFVLKNGRYVEVEFTLTFAKPMKESDIVVRAWDTKRYSTDIRFVKAFEVVEGPQSELVEVPSDKDETIEEAPTNKIKIDIPTFEKWAGYSDQSISDSELLNQIGITGKSIPSWYKKTVASWIHKGEVSYDDFVNALKFFEKRKLLG